MATGVDSGTTGGPLARLIPEAIAHLEAGRAEAGLAGLRAALAEAPGTIHQAQIEDEDGRVVWDVEVDGTDGARHDIQVDAQTGAIVEHDVDDD